MCSVLFLLLSIVMMILLVAKEAKKGLNATEGGRTVWRTLLTHWVAVLLGIIDVVAVVPMTMLCWVHVMLVGESVRLNVGGEEYDDAGVSTG